MSYALFDTRKTDRARFGPAAARPQAAAADVDLAAVGAAGIWHRLCQLERRLRGRAAGQRAGNHHSQPAGGGAWAAGTYVARDSHNRLSSTAKAANEPRPARLREQGRARRAGTTP